MAYVYAFLSSYRKSIITNPPIGWFNPDRRYSITISPEVHFEDYKLKYKKYIPFTVNKDTYETPVKVKRNAEYGDILGVSDEFMGYKYAHYGIYVGNNKVIHYISTTGKVEDAKIQETDMCPYFPNGNFFVSDFKNLVKFTAGETV